MHEILLYDERPFEHEYFSRIAQTFLFLKTLTIYILSFTLDFVSIRNKYSMGCAVDLLCMTGQQVIFFCPDLSLNGLKAMSLFYHLSITSEYIIWISCSLRTIFRLFFKCSTSTFHCCYSFSDGFSSIKRLYSNFLSQEYQIYLIENSCYYRHQSNIILL